MTPELNSHNKEEHPASHTAEHIINRAMLEAFGCGRAVEAHIERKKSKLDFALAEAPTEEQMKAVESTVNEVIDKHLPVTFQFITQQEAAERFDLRRLPADASETVRVVCVGHYDQCLCIGQHVANTAEIGHVRFLSHDYNTDTHRLRLRWKVEQQ